MLQRTAFMLAVAVGALVPALSQAQEEPRGDRPAPEALFERMDADKDGKLSVAEIPARIKERLGDRLRERLGDDEALSLEEFREFLREAGPPRGDRRPEGAPEDGRPEGRRRERDGERAPEGRRPEPRPDRPQRGEFFGPPGGLPAPKELFDRLDRDDNGQLSFEEFEPFLQRLQQMRTMGRPPMDGPPGAAMFRNMDTNGDEKIDRDEARGPLQEHFDRVDRDSDGTLSPSEVGAAVRRLARERGDGPPPRAEGDGPPPPRGGRPDGPPPPREGRPAGPPPGDGPAGPPPAERP